MRLKEIILKEILEPHKIAKNTLIRHNEIFIDIDDLLDDVYETIKYDRYYNIAYTKETRNKLLRMINHIDPFNLANFLYRKVYEDKNLMLEILQDMIEDPNRDVVNVIEYFLNYMKANSLYEKIVLIQEKLKIEYMLIWESHTERDYLIYLPQYKILLLVYEAKNSIRIRIIHKIEDFDISYDKESIRKGKFYIEYNEVDYTDVPAFVKEIIELSYTKYKIIDAKYEKEN